MSVQNKIHRNTLRTLAAKKNVERVTMLTAYDVMTSRILDSAGIDILLVGDSLGNVIYGFDSTLPVTLEMTLQHSAAVVRGSEKAFVLADLPFLTYQVNSDEAIRNAGRCLSEAGVQGVKLEGASPKILETISRLVEVGIPVMGHIGLTPQSVHQMGGFYTHGKKLSDADRIFNEALALEKAGCFAIVLECVEESLAKRITNALNILTIGIGSGSVCDGEVLVVNDILGYTSGATPKFAKQYVDIKGMVQLAAEKFIQDVKISKIQAAEPTVAAPPTATVAVKAVSPVTPQHITSADIAKLFGNQP